MSANSSSNIIKQATVNDRAGVSSAASSSPASGTVIKQQVIEAQAEARRILGEAEAYAASVRAEIDETARATREAAYREGHEAGLLELHSLLLEAHERRDTALAAAEEDLLRLSIKLAEKIIGREITRDDETIADIVSTALDEARQQEQLTVRVNPADIRAVHAHRERLDAIGRARFLNIVADHRVSAGGCRIESEAGTIDAQLATQLRVLERALLARFSGEQN